MSLKYEIKDFFNDDGKKYVGLKITDSDTNKQFVIDKKVTLVDGKTDEQYVTDAIALAKTETDDWVASIQYVGREFNATNTSSGSFM